MTEGDTLTEDQIRASSNRVSRVLFLAFGVVLGLIAGLLTVVEHPPRVVHEEFVASEGKGVGGGVQDPAETDDTTPGGTRYVTKEGTAGSAGGEVAGPAAEGAGPAAAALNPKDYECAPGKNGGATAPGVSATQIKVSANVVLDGVGASFLKEAIIGIQAVLDGANVKGICGRKIALTHRNDSWSAATGLQYIENYINDQVFALVVNPSSEGLNNAVQNGTIDGAGIPVVGSDGMLISQYRWPADSSSPGLAKWVWPVAASTVSTMHIILQHAAQQGAKTFGLVYDAKYKFGVEGKDAFVGAFKRLQDQYGLIANGPNGNPYTLAIEQPDASDYSGLVNGDNGFNAKCGPDGANAKCDAVIMLLTPSTGITWIKAGATFGGRLTAGPQPLFNRDFAVNCVEERNKLNKTCDLTVWTGYNPPVGALATQPDVAKFVADVESRNAQADTENSFTEGAYLGAKVFVEALNRVGPNLTSDNLRAVLDSMTYQSDLTNTLTWSADSHFANIRMHGFKVGYTPNGFAGWQDANTGWIEDQWVGRY